MTKKRGRKSADELSVTVLMAAAPAPDAPYDLNDETASIWRGIVDALPNGFIPREMDDVLANYCRHTATAKFVSRELDRFTIDWLKVEGGVERLNKLSSLRDREVRAMLACARSLRLTSQSRYRAETAATMRDRIASGAQRPWEPSK